MNGNAPVVAVVDNDLAVRDSMRDLLNAAGYGADIYATAEDFLAEVTPESIRCLIASVRLAGMNGIALLAEVTRRKLGIPVILMTAHPCIAAAVGAMREGAADYIEKPFEADALLSSVQHAILSGDAARGRAAEVASANLLVALLTPRECNVLDQLVSGHSNKLAGHELGISPRTVEIHRAHIMSKMSAKSVADLIRISLTARGPRHTDTRTDHLTAAKCLVSGLRDTVRRD